MDRRRPEAPAPPAVSDRRLRVVGPRAVRLAGDPFFADLEELDAVIAAAHRRGRRVAVDLESNTCTTDHPWFLAAVAAGRGSRARAVFRFAEGRGCHGDRPPDDRRDEDDGPAWSRVTEPDGRPGQWYLHLTDPGRPDLDWDEPRVVQHFDQVLRFWLDRAVDEIRVDPPTEAGRRHPVWRRWQAVCDEYTVRDGRERLLRESAVRRGPADPPDRTGAGGSGADDEEPGRAFPRPRLVAPSGGEHRRHSR
ncbi:alpha-amylase family glycosyl hydrolase [Actinacidiphila alni]|uniref:alpha-amylase family glycosyl hydrolase n=1 Tax=Actinacidiphila alni TaxID=380248 RepID=UPI0015A66429|nr:alpha-amylase family glycosyl hydrolase [Actinacidiphila alni]